MREEPTEEKLKTIKRLFSEKPAYVWFLCEIPLFLVLFITAVVDPAEGFDSASGQFYLYIPAILFTVLFSMALNWIKGWFVLYFAKINCGMRESAKLLCQIHSVMAILEAVYTLLLFFLRKVSSYGVFEQIALFGHQLLYAVLLYLYIREESEVSYRRCRIIGLVCFFASSAWLLLSVIAAL